MRLIVFVLMSHAAWSEVLQHPYFFEAKKDGKVSYLFGTNHIGVGLTDIPDYILAKLKHQKIFMTETLKDQKEPDSKEPKTETPAKPLSAYTLEQMKARGMDERWIQMAQKIPNLMCTLYESYEGIRDRLILDEQFEDLATLEGKTKLALDDAATMTKVNEKNRSECDPEQVTHETPGIEAKKQYNQRLFIYRKGDLKDSEVDPKDDPNDIVRRNKIWLAKIIKHHPQSPFIIMGYGHLGGPSGILHLLNEQGFTIRRVEAAI